MINKIAAVVSVIGLVVLGFMIGRCSSKRDSSIMLPPVVIRDTIYGDIPDPVIIIKEVPADVDTSAILESYFSEKIYNDTILYYPELQISLTDIVNQNSLLDRRIFVNYQRPPMPKYNAFSIGADISYMSVPLYLSYRHKRMTYRLGYDFINKSLIGGFSFDLLQW